MRPARPSSRAARHAAVPIGIAGLVLALSPLMATATPGPATSVWPGLLNTPADWAIHLDARLPALPGSLAGPVEHAWQQAIKQAGNCIKGETGGGAARGTDPGTASPGPSSSGTGGRPAPRSGAAGDGDDPDRYACPRRLDAEVPTLQVAAFRMILQRTAMLAYALGTDDPALAWPLQSILRQWVEHIDRWAASMAPAALAIRLDEQGRALIALHAHMNGIATALRDRPQSDAFLSAPMAHGLRDQLIMTRRGFSPEGLSVLTDRVGALHALVQAPPPPTRYQAAAITARNLAWSQLASTYIRQMQPGEREVARAMHRRLSATVAGVGPQHTAALARLARATARATAVSVLLDELALSPGSVMLFMRPRGDALALRRDMQRGPWPFEHSLERLGWFMQRCAAIDPRSQPEWLASVLARALQEEGARAQGQLTPLAPLDARDRLQALIRTLTPDGAVEIVRSLIELRAQLRIGLTLAERSPRAPEGLATEVRQQLAVSLQNLDPTHPSAAYVRMRDALHTARMTLEQALLPETRNDLEQIRRMLRDAPGLAAGHGRELEQIVWPALDMIRNNLSLRDVFSIGLIRRHLEKHLERLQTVDARFFSLFAEFMLSTDYNQPPRYWSRHLVDRSYTIPLAYDLQHWLAQPAPAAPAPSPPMRHDEL